MGDQVAGCATYQKSHDWLHDPHIAGYKAVITVTSSSTIELLPPAVLSVVSGANQIGADVQIGGSRPGPYTSINASTRLMYGHMIASFM